MSAIAHKDQAALWPLGRGLLWAAIGFGFGAALTSLLRAAGGWSPWSFGLDFSIGYVFALLGWLMGVGMWESWGRTWFGRPPVDEGPADWRRYLAFTTDHKVVGVQYLVTFVAVFLLAGLMAVVIRIQYLSPSGEILNQEAYNRLMSMHGILMIAVAVAIMLGGFGNYMVPLLVGARDVAFPRVNALSFWLVPPVAILLFASEGFGGWDSGWTAYAPLSDVNPAGQILFCLAIITFGVSSILGGLNFLTTITQLRARGMTWGRMPIFVWAVYAASWISLLFTQFFAAAMLMVLLDRVVGMSFFDARHGGSAMLYQHVFWFYSHPAVYIMALPGLGITLEVLSHFSRKPVFAYRWAVGGFLGILGLSGVVWVHHMFLTGVPYALEAPFLVSTELISIPTGIVFLSALGTIWGGRLWLRTPMLFALSVVFNFLIGGITGIFLADVPTDAMLHNSFFVVAHFHYTIMGGEIFALFAAIYYWFPKMTGRMYSEALGKLHFWLMFVGFNLTFLIMFWPGLHGMNRRIASYTPSLQGVNQVISAVSMVLAASFLFFIFNMLRSLIAGRRAAADPWRARTLEWQTSSPPPVENFPLPPVIAGTPYGYGVLGGSPHAVFAPAGASEEGAS